MDIFPRKSCSLSLFAILSLLVHGIAGYTLARVGGYDFTRPVTGGSPVIIELRDMEDVTQTSRRLPSAFIREPPPSSETSAFGSGRAVSIAGETADDDGADPTSGGRGDHLSGEEIRSAGRDSGDTVKGEGGGNEPDLENPGRGPGHAPASGNARAGKEAALSQGRTATEFLSAVREKLTYQISLYSIPVGIAVLEAVNERGNVRITSTVRSNAVISGFYPVDDFSETSLIGGKYIISRIRQREGSFRSDSGFTLCLPEKSVVWVDRLRKVVVTHPLDDDDVLDIVSGFYFLRNQPLKVGKVVLLNIFDSNRAAASPVEVLRRERLRLPGLREADTLVIRPALQTNGLFRRSGDILVWLTDDEYKVPLRMETTIPLGRVTAELISAEAEHQGKGEQPAAK